jgi:phosphohistidine phosphatase
VSIRTIYHSGKHRAEQTAAVFGGALEPADGVRELPGLAPRDDPESVARALVGMTGPVMLVGHLPHLSHLAAFLLTNDASREVVAIRHAGIVCLATGNDGRWRIRWYLIPGLIGP